MGATHFTGPVYSENGFIGATSNTGVDLTLTGFIATPAVKAGDGTAAITIANSTGVVTVAAGLTITDAKNIVVGSTTGTKIGTATTQKIGFFNATPVVQPSTTGTTTGFTAGAGTAVLDDSTFTGGSGSKAYTVGDIVKALKALGILAAS
jgi:hypothetical protein